MKLLFFIYCAVLLTILLFTTYIQSSTIIATITGFGACDGEQVQFTLLNAPSGVVMANDDMLITDQNNHRIRKIFSNGTIITIAGTGFLGYNGENILATKILLGAPYGITINFNGEVYFSEKLNHRIRKILNNGTIIIIAETRFPGYNRDNILATTARLNTPAGVTIDSNGQVFFADMLNNKVRKILTNRTITTIAGTGTYGYNGDNILATTAQLKNPSSVVVDLNGEVYIGDTLNHRVRKILINGTITIITGTGSTLNNGDNILATITRLNKPNGITVDSINSKVYIADINNNRVHKILTNGLITTIAGTGSSFYNEDNILAKTVQLSSPIDIAKKKDGGILIVEMSGNRIREILSNRNIITVVGTGAATYCGNDALVSNVLRILIVLNFAI